MFFVEVDKIPRSRPFRNAEIKKLLDDFLESNIRCAKIILKEEETMPAIYEFRHFTQGDQYSTRVSVQERQDGVYLKRLNNQIES